MKQFGVFIVIYNLSLSAMEIKCPADYIDYEIGQYTSTENRLECRKRALHHLLYFSPMIFSSLPPAVFKATLKEVKILNDCWYTTKIKALEDNRGKQPQAPPLPTFSILKPADINEFASSSRQKYQKLIRDITLEKINVTQVLTIEKKTKKLRDNVWCLFYEATKPAREKAIIHLVTSPVWSIVREQLPPEKQLLAYALRHQQVPEPVPEAQ